MSAEASRENCVPRANPWARYAAVVIGLILLAVAVVCARELWLRNSRSIHWDSWVDPIVTTVGNATYQPWMLPAGFASFFLGVFLVWVAVRPSTRTHRAVGEPSGASVWMRPVDLARMLSATARTVPGVAEAASRVSGQSATVSVAARQGDVDLTPAVEAALAPVLSELGIELNLRVRQRTFEEAHR